MPYRESVESRITRATTTVQSADLSTLMFVTANNYIGSRTMSFGSFTEVRDMTNISTDSNTYNALRLAFTAGPRRVMLGRRKIDKASYSVPVDRVGKVTVYTLTIKTNDDVSTATYTSTVGDTQEMILAELKTLIDAGDADITTLVSGTGASAKLEVTDSTVVNHVASAVKNLSVTFETTETAADLFAALVEEAEDEFYRLACEDHTPAFILAMAAEVETTETSNFPKRYHVSVAETEVLMPLPDPAVDTLGKLKELGYTRTESRWHHLADTLFPEVYTAIRVGKYISGSTNYKFVIPQGIPAAANPATGKRLSTALQGYIADRNASWFGVERGQNFNHGGKSPSGEWLDVIDAVDYLNDQIEVRLLNLEINSVATGGKISFTASDKTRVANVVDGVLKEAVDAKILSGYIPTVVPDNVPFQDQANRILQNIKWTGYLAGAVNFLVVDGILTYQDASLS